MLTQATASTIPFSTYLADLSLLTPKNVWFTSVTLTATVTPGSITDAASAPATVGSVSFSGQALAHNDVATWLDNAAKEVGFANPYFSSSTESLIPGTGTAPGLDPEDVGHVQLVRQSHIRGAVRRPAGKVLTCLESNSGLPAP